MSGSVSRLTDVVVSPDQPFEVEFKVFEEDTFLVMSASNHIRAIREPLEELQVKATDQSPLPLGKLELRGNAAFAVVHDFDRAVPFSEAAAQDCLADLCRHIEKGEIASLAIQALGGFHRAEPLEESVRRIHEVNWPDCLEKIWVITPK